MAIVIVFVLPVYSRIEELNSVIIVIQLIMAPDMTPAPIIGSVTRKNVFILEAPRLSDASSTLIPVCLRIAALERMVYGIRLIVNATTIMAPVPAIIRGF